MKVREYQAKFEDKGLQVMTISAATGDNISELVQVLGKRVFSEQ
jgi:hypothetical protein